MTDHVEVAVGGAADLNIPCERCNYSMLIRVEPGTERPVSAFCGRWGCAEFCIERLLEGRDDD
jgi:hypothetical protein